MGGPGAVAGAGGAPSVTTVGGAAPGTGAADGGGPARARAAGGGEADVVAAAAAVADSRLSVLSPVDVIRHQSLGGGLRHAIPLVAPAVPPLPPPSLPPSLQHIRGSGPLTPAMQHLSLQNGGLAAQALQAHYHQAAPDGTHAPPDAYAVHMAAAAAAADAHVAPYELTWGWDHRAELGSEELERARQHAVMVSESGREGQRDLRLPGGAGGKGDKRSLKERPASLHRGRVRGLSAHTRWSTCAS